jgi:general secretion pathway protein K
VVLSLNIARQKGLAMVLVIWVLSLLTIMAGSFALTMRRETIVISSVKDSAIALAAAETGVTIAQKMLMLTDNDKRWNADGSVYQIQYQDTEIRVRLFSEQGKIDINKASEELLTAMMSATELELEKQQELVYAIMDWRDKDDLIHINGAEKKQYEDAGLDYHPANKDFQLIDELQLVLGMNPVIYQQLQALITVYSGQATVNRTLAAKEVLAVIADPETEDETIDEYIKQRMENNNASPADSRLTLQDNVEGNQSANNKNSVYTIISQARLFADTEAGIKITLKNTGQANSFQVLDYRQLYQDVSLFGDEMEQFLVVEQDEPE